MSTQQTGEATPQTAATCKESLQVHAPDPRQQQAARLREMGKLYRRAAETSRYHEKHCRADMFLASAELHSVDAESHEANAAALRAGADAIERGGVLEARIAEIADQLERSPAGVCTCDPCVAIRLRAALACLEAL